MKINMQQFDAAVRFVSENNPYYTEMYKKKFAPTNRPNGGYSELHEVHQRSVRALVRKSMTTTAKRLIDDYEKDSVRCFICTGGYAVIMMDDDWIEFLVDPATGKPPAFHDLAKFGLHFLGQEKKDASDE